MCSSTYIPDVCKNAAGKPAGRAPMRRKIPDAPHDMTQA